MLIICACKSNSFVRASRDWGVLGGNFQSYFHLKVPTAMAWAPAARLRATESREHVPSSADRGTRSCSEAAALRGGWVSPRGERVPSFPSRWAALRRLPAHACSSAHFSTSSSKGWGGTGLPPSIQRSWASSRPSPGFMAQGRGLGTPPPRNGKPK